MEKYYYYYYYYWLDNINKIEDLLNLIVNNEKVAIEQHDLGEKGILYEIKVGEEFKVD